MKDFLREVVNLKRKEIEAAKAKLPITHFAESRRLLKGLRPFREAISRGGRINLIAEIKKKSPSRKKPFFRKLDIRSLASIYEKSGAGAISVLTDKKFFGGRVSHINEVRKTVNLPVLRKDFIIDEYQVYESRYFGADAILLIARILTNGQIKSFMHLAKRIGMDPVVEVHDDYDLEKALVSDAKIIGINNRDLDTFTIDMETTLRLIPRIPEGITTISESGIKSRDDISRLEEIGVNAVLIGSSFLEAGDIAARVREIWGDNRI